MLERTTLRAADGVALDAWRCAPAGTPIGGLVVLQEIFGVNPHIRTVVERFAAQGFLTIAPCLFDRSERGVELGYDAAAQARGRALAAQLPLEARLPDIRAAITAVSAAGRVGVVGYCWGGSLACLVAGSDAPVACAVSYYGSASLRLQQAPVIPLLLHFGEEDPHIPISEVRALAARLPAVPIATYPAGHGFSCDARPSFHAPSAALAGERTQAFLLRHLHPSG